MSMSIIIIVSSMLADIIDYHSLILDSSRSSIRATPHGFRMVHEEANLSSESKADANTSGLHKAAEVMWKMGESYGNDNAWCCHVQQCNLVSCA